MSKKEKKNPTNPRLELQSTEYLVWATLYSMRHALMCYQYVRTDTFPTLLDNFISYVPISTHIQMADISTLLKARFNLA